MTILVFRDLRREMLIHFIDIDARRVATRTQKRSCVHIENVDKNENMVNLGHMVRIKLN